MPTPLPAFDFAGHELWFVAGSQHLYGEETLARVAEHAQEVADHLSASGRPPVKVVCKPVLTGPEAVLSLCREANAAPACVGLVTWMHTFSPAKMWLAGLAELRKPLCHLHTQFDREIPWATLDMDYMNLNQSAHGGREFGFVNARLRRPRKVVVGHWKDDEVLDRLDAWARAACAHADARRLRVARLGDNMRHVAVTEGDKVEAQRVYGYEVHGHGVGDLVAHVDAAADADVDALIEAYGNEYEVAEDLRPGGARHAGVRAAARIEAGLRSFLGENRFGAFTDTFEDLHGLEQLPGLAVQRLMADGVGFGGEGDWKTAALVRAMKVMAQGLTGGTSFMEDYVYDLTPGQERVLGAHMLEICPSISSGKPSLEVHPLGIGGKADPARLVFGSPAGPAINASVIDVGSRFRMILNAVEAVDVPEALPQLPVARAYWKPLPDLKTAAAAWIHAGGAHHTGYSQALTLEHLEDYAEITGTECVVIDADTRLRAFRSELRTNDVAWHLSRGL